MARLGVPLDLGNTLASGRSPEDCPLPLVHAVDAPGVHGFVVDGIDVAVLSWLEQ